MKKTLRIILVLLPIFLMITNLTHADKKISEETIKKSDEWFNKGASLIESGKYQDAIGALNKAIELNPRSAAAYTYRGGRQLFQTTIRQSY